MAVELFIATFENDETRAGEVLKSIKQLDKDGALKVYNVAAITCPKEGPVEVKDVGDVSLIYVLKKGVSCALVDNKDEDVAAFGSKADALTAIQNVSPDHYLLVGYVVPAGGEQSEAPVEENAENTAPEVEEPEPETTEEVEETEEVEPAPEPEDVDEDADNVEEAEEEKDK